MHCGIICIYNVIINQKVNQKMKGSAIEKKSNLRFIFLCLSSEKPWPCDLWQAVCHLDFWAKKKTQQLQASTDTHTQTDNNEHRQAWAQKDSHSKRQTETNMCRRTDWEKNPRRRTQTESDPHRYCWTASGDTGRTICREAAEVNLKKVSLKPESAWRFHD